MSDPIKPLFDVSEPQTVVKPKAADDPKPVSEPKAVDDPVVVSAATDHKTTASRPVEPTVVTMLSTGDGSKLSSGTIAVTDGAHQPNIIIKVVTPIAMMLVRGAKAFMVSWLAIMPVAGVTGIIPVHSFVELAAKAAGLSIGVGLLAVGNTFVEILTKLDQKFPSWTA